ncbi:NEK11 kinase, partial [Polypterus senegalus]|nr:NEK11 kinase [Polypterus senegalus]
KVLKRILLGDLRGDETVSFAKEAQLLSSLQHPAIVHFYSSFAELDSFCIVTEYCEGGDLHNKLCQRQAIKKLYSEKQVVEWLIQILLGVQYLHDRSLGCILYEMATLTQAFNAHSWVKLVHKIVEEPAPVLPGCFSRELNDILQR